MFLTSFLLCLSFIILLLMGDDMLGRRWKNPKLCPIFSSFIFPVTFSFLFLFHSLYPWILVLCPSFSSSTSHFHNFVIAIQPVIPVLVILVSGRYYNFFLFLGLIIVNSYFFNVRKKFNLPLACLLLIYDWFSSIG